MNDDERREDDGRLEREIRAWANRPPARSPQVARTRVLARLDERRAWPMWKAWPVWRYAAAAAMVLVVLTSAILLRGPETPPGTPIETLAEQPTAGMLVYELGSGTKLYVALQPSDSNRPSQGENG